MARSPKLYQRLPGASSSAFEHLRLYLASDHLLLVASSGFNESYRRFFFRDIQAFTIRRTRGRMWWNIALGVPLSFLLLILLAWFLDASQAALQSDELVGLIFSGITALILLTFLIINTVRGPTCACEIRTAVQTRRLSTLGRVRGAQKVIAQLIPLIEAAQQPLPPEELARRLDAARQGVSPVFDAPPVIAAPAPPPSAISSGDVQPSTHS